MPLDKIFKLISMKRFLTLLLLNKIYNKIFDTYIVQNTLHEWYSPYQIYLINWLKNSFGLMSTICLSVSPPYTLHRL